MTSPTAAPDRTNETARKALDVDSANLALGHETFEAAGATFVRNRAYPAIYDANHITHVGASTPEEIDRLLSRANAEYDGLNHRRFDVDFRTPPSFVARLAMEGYERSDALVMLLESDLIGAAPQHDIRPVETEADWRAHAALHQIDWQAHTERRKLAEPADVPEQMRGANRGKQPPVQNFLAYVHGRPVAYLNSWAGIDGVGQVENLFTHPEFRRRGLATALIHHCVADCRLKGAGPVVIVADPTDTPKQMYGAMGFRPIAIYSHYLKKLAS